MFDRRAPQGHPSAVAVRSRSVQDVREDPMYQTVDGSNPGPAAPKSAPVTGGTPPRPLDGAWQLWEQLRSWDQRFAIVVDTTLALGLFLVCSGWFCSPGSPIPTCGSWPG